MKTKLTTATSSTLRRALALAALSLATLGASHACAQARLTFSGGLGTPLTLTLNAPVTYAVTREGSANNAPSFDIQGIGNVFNFAGVGYVGSGNIGFTVNGAAAQTLYMLNSGFASNDVAATDGSLSGPEPGVPLGSTVVLNAGSLTTANNFAGAPPADGDYPTFLFDSPGFRLDAVNGVSAPEPGAWTLLGVGMTGAGVIALRRLRRASRA